MAKPPRSGAQPLPGLLPLALAGLCALGAGANAMAAGPAAAPARAAPAEHTWSVPVRLNLPGGQGHQGQISVLEVSLPDRRSRPFVLLLHGRPASSRAFPTLGRVDYPANARYFVAQGFDVFIPTRLGYGISGGPDVEASGSCENEDYAAAIGPALEEIDQVVAFIRARHNVGHRSAPAPRRGLILGESFGGLLAIATAAHPPQGVVGVINISGGDGGDVQQHPDRPCQPERLQQLFAQLGNLDRLPTLWLYSQNDRLWGPEWPRHWFDAFHAAGGRGNFVALPADKNNGHYVFNRNPMLWHPPVEQFLQQLGAALPVPR